MTKNEAHQQLEALWTMHIDAFSVIEVAHSAFALAPLTQHLLSVAYTNKSYRQAYLDTLFTTGCAKTARQYLT